MTAFEVDEQPVETAFCLCLITSLGGFGCSCFSVKALWVVRTIRSRGKHVSNHSNQTLQTWQFFSLLVIDMFRNFFQFIFSFFHQPEINITPKFTFAWFDFCIFEFVSSKLFPKVISVLNKSLNNRKNSSILSINLANLQD